MIKSIIPGNGITVQNSSSQWPSFYNQNYNNSLMGQVRYNGSNQNIEVYDGSVWVTINSAFPTIELNSEVQGILNWARGKIAEEFRIKELAAKHPSVADALEAVTRAEEQVKIVAALVDTE